MIVEFYDNNHQVAGAAICDAQWMIAEIQFLPGKPSLKNTDAQLKKLGWSLTSGRPRPANQGGAF